MSWPSTFFDIKALPQESSLTLSDARYSQHVLPLSVRYLLSMCSDAVTLLGPFLDRMCKSWLGSINGGQCCKFTL